ncbi:SRPBCC family protein [Streptomyces sp. NPDC001816]|uniref:SRPBCC family protein n=1 Tax=Streptomyces sp. NPDC001816 TaxID=3364612 RepID=UPI0036AEACC0
MQSVTVSIDVPQTPEQVYDFLDVMAHHERFTSHYLTHWRYSGPSRGVGSGATVTAALAGAKTEVIIEVVEAEPPLRCSPAFPPDAPVSGGIAGGCQSGLRRC